MFIKDGTRFNINQVLLLDGVTYGYGQLLQFPHVMAVLNIVEIPDPVRPAGFNEDESIWNETAEAPYFAITARDPEQVARTKATKRRDVAQKYLDDTDYLFTTDRHMELITLEPGREGELVVKRTEAREAIRAHKAAYPEPVL